MARCGRFSLWTAGTFHRYNAPRIFSSDNLPTNAKEFSREMPSTALTTDAKHFLARVKNTFRSTSPHFGAQCKGLSRMFFKQYNVEVDLSSDLSELSPDLEPGSRQCAASRP